MLKSLNPVTLPDSSCHDLCNATNKRNYRIFVGGIRHGQVEAAPRPLVFVLDGNWLFASVYEYLRTLSIFDPSIGDPVIVGIGYPTDDTGTLLRLRKRDLEPKPDNISNVRQFLTFITDDVLTFLQSELDIVPGKKILAGHSMGGSFALFAMGTEKAGIDGYLASSPPILGTVMEEIDQHVRNIAITKEVKLFCSLGADESVKFPHISTGFPLLMEALEQFAPENLRYRHVIFEDENHSSVTHAALSRGLRYLLT